MTVAAATATTLSGCDEGDDDDAVKTVASDAATTRHDDPAAIQYNNGSGNLTLDSQTGNHVYPLDRRHPSMLQTEERSGTRHHRSIAVA